MRTFILSALLCLTLAGSAQARFLNADRVSEPQSLLPYCGWLMDKNGELGIGDVSSGPFLERFAFLSSLPIKTSGPVWIRLALFRDQPSMGGSVAPAKRPRLIINLGQLPQGRNEIHFSKAPGPVTADGVWHTEAVGSHEDILLPDPGLLPMSVFIRLEEMPGPWFAPLVQAESATRPDILPAELLLPGLLIAAAIACLLRAIAGRAQWAFWSALFLSMGVCQAVLPLPTFTRGVTFADLPALLAPGLAVLLLPHVARCMFRTDQEPGGRDRLLYFCSFLGAGVALVPLVPGYGWLCRLFPLAPLLFFPLLPLCLGALSNKRPGSLALTGAAVMPMLGAGLALYALTGHIPHPLTKALAAQGGLWGMAVGGIGLALARLPRKGPAGRDTRNDVAEEAGLALAGLSTDAALAGAEQKGQDTDRDLTNLSLYDEMALPFMNAGLYPPKEQGGTESPVGDTLEYPRIDPFQDILAEKTGKAADAEGTPGTPEGTAKTLEMPQPFDFTLPKEAPPHAPEGKEPAPKPEPVRYATPPNDAAFPIVGDSGADMPRALAQYAAEAREAPVLSPLLPAFAEASYSAALPEIGGKTISLVDEDFSDYSLPLMDELAELPARHITLTPEGGYLFNLHSLVREVHDIITPLAKAKGLLFSWFIAPSLPVLLEGDAPRLRGALSLLLQNAVQASPQGAVQLAVRQRPGASDPGDLLFTISDNGSAQRTDAGFFHAWELAGKSGGSFNVDYSPVGGTCVSFSVCFSLPSEEAARKHLALAPVSTELAAELAAELTEEAPDAPAPEADSRPYSGDIPDVTHAREQPAGVEWGPPEAPPAPLGVSKSGSALFAPDSIPPQDSWKSAAGRVPLEAPDRISDPLSAHISDHHRDILAGLVHTGAASFFKPVPDQASSPREPRIIAAEMTTSKRKLLTHYLQELPCELLYARTEAEFMALAEEGDPALYLFDGDMPEQDIIRTMSALSNMPKSSSARRSPVLVLTGHESQSERLRRAGADYTLIKPFQRDELCAIVTSVLPCGSPADEEAPAVQADAAPLPGPQALTPTTTERETDILPEALKDAPEGGTGSSFEAPLSPVASASSGFVAPDNESPAHPKELAPTQKDPRPQTTEPAPPARTDAPCADRIAPEGGGVSTPPAARNAAVSALATDENRAPKRPVMTTTVARVISSTKSRTAAGQPAKNGTPHTGESVITLGTVPCDTPSPTVTVSTPQPCAAAALPDPKPAHETDARPSISPASPPVAIGENGTARRETETAVDAPKQSAAVFVNAAATGVTPDDGRERPDSLLDFALPGESGGSHLPEPAEREGHADTAGLKTPVGVDACAPPMREPVAPDAPVGEKAPTPTASPDAGVSAPCFTDEALTTAGVSAARLSSKQGPERQAESAGYPLPGIEGEALDVSVLPLAPGIVHALDDILKDVEEAHANDSSMLMQDATARLALKAEHFGMHKLGRIARCVERAAEAGDGEAVRTLYEDLAPITKRYMNAIQACFQNYLDCER